MLLAIDIGNTNIHMGLWQANSWAISWRARTVADKMPDEYAVLLRSFLAASEIDPKTITGIIISSVVPRLTGVFTQMAERYLGLEPLILTNTIKTGVRLDIDQPEQAGADRIANASAAYTLYGGPAIVVDFGTATNFDVISADGAYMGGALAPGIGVAHDALVSRAAKLHKVDLIAPPDPIGRNTIHALQSGIFLGYVGLVEGLVTRIRASLEDDAATVIATGGFAPTISEHTDVIDIIAPTLTLDGLRIIYRLNRGELE